LLVRGPATVSYEVGHSMRCDVAAAILGGENFELLVQAN